MRKLVIILIFLITACSSDRQVNPALDGAIPRKILWAWERPEDLRFLNPNEFGVAFLAQTINLETDRITAQKRRQPLEVTPETYLIAVTRIESKSDAFSRSFSETPENIALRQKTVALIKSTLDLPDVKGIQIDFDAVVSERTFYRSLMIELRKQTPENIPLTMTSLASWCTGDAWFNDFPVDEAVPMVFQMGADSDNIKTYLRNGNDWREPLCRGSYGISLEEGKFEGIKEGRRMFYFKNSAWHAGDVDEKR